MFVRLESLSWTLSQGRGTFDVHEGFEGTGAVGLFEHSGHQYRINLILRSPRYHHKYSDDGQVDEYFWDIY